MPQQSNSPNLLLSSLGEDDFELLRARLRPVELRQEVVLYGAGDIIDHVYFPNTGVVSLVVGLASGDMIETGMVGRDSLVGGSSALDGKVSLNTAIVQIAGSGSSLKLEHLRDAADASITFRTTLIRHEQMILVQAQQSAACNASHTVETRLARWLLRSRDLMGGDDLALTQEFLSQMLGVRRTSVSVVANTFQQAGFIRYSRGHIRILNLEGLRETACECYQTVKAQAERLLAPHRDIPPPKSIAAMSGSL